jgi:hypothetical protein
MLMKHIHLLGLLVSLSLSLSGCKARHEPGVARAFNSEVADACLPNSVAVDSGCGVSFPYDYVAPPEAFEKYSKAFAPQNIKYQYPQIYEAGTKHGLRVEEIAAVNNYTKGDYGPLNNDLRRKDFENSIRKETIMVTVSGLRKLPRFKGTVFRGSHIRPEILQKYEESLAKKIPVQELGFTSTSKDEAKADKFAAAGGKFIIESSYGAEVENISKFPEEQEVLFAPGTYFQVIDIKLNADDSQKPIIMMKELVVE